MQRIKVLIVEDTKIWRNILQRNLTAFGCDVDLAADFEEAWRKLDYNIYDMVTLDMALSSEEEAIRVAASGGWSLLSKLKQVSPATAIFVISASFGTEPKRAFELQAEYSVRDFMTKEDDFNPETLQRWVEEIRRLKQTEEPATTPQVDDRRDSAPGVSREHLITLRQLLTVRFNEGEVRTLCFDLGVSYDGLPGDGKDNKVRELVAYCERHRSVPDLEAAIRRLRPDIGEAFTGGTVS